MHLEAQIRGNWRCLEERVLALSVYTFYAVESKRSNDGYFNVDLHLCSIIWRSCRLRLCFQPSRLSGMAVKPMTHAVAEKNSAQCQ